MLKKAAAQVNRDLGKLAADKARPDRRRRPTRSIAGKLDAQFPLRVWQTGSGTQTNMNVNEVISNRAIELAGGEMGSKKPDPSQRRRQHVAVLQRHLPDRDAHRGGRGDRHIGCCPRCESCATRCTPRRRSSRDIVKIGRTHLMDAMPLTLGQEFSGYVAQLDADIKRIRAVLPDIYELALGGTAVGTGLNTHPGVRRARGERDRRADRAAVRHGAQQVRGAGRRTTRW